MAYVKSTSLTSTGVKAGANIVLTFSGPVVAGTGKFTIRDSSTYGVVYEFESTSSYVKIVGNVVTINPPADLKYATSYSVNMPSGWVAEVGGAKADYYSTSFRTELSPVAVKLTGTENGETMYGSDLGDTLDGLGGGDTLYGYGGDDILRGGDESGSYSGDTLVGGGGHDTLFGGKGDDGLQGDAGNDTLYGGDGKDRLDGGEGDDLLDGGAGDDSFTVSYGKDTLSGGEGNDSITVYYSGNTSSIDGGAGNDRLEVRSSNTVTGGDGDDQINVQGDTNGVSGSIDGGAGNDSISLSLRRTATSELTVTGGEGVDTYMLRADNYGDTGTYRCTVTDFMPGEGGDRIDLNILWPFAAKSGNPFSENGILRLQADGSDTLLMLKNGTYQALVRFKNVLPSQFTKANFVGAYSPDGGDVGLNLSGTADEDKLAGYALHDTLRGGDGSDVLEGNGGDDFLEGGSESAADGNDRLLGGAGNDTLKGGAGGDTLNGGAGDDVIDGGSGNDTIDDFEGKVSILGGTGNDTINIYNSTGGTVDGGDGDDNIQADSKGDVTVYGGAGKDTIVVGGYNWDKRTATVSGGDGDDTIRFVLNGDQQAAVVSGGSGADKFVVTTLPYSGAWKITIEDFVPGSGDQIDVTNVMPSGLAGNPFGALAYLRATQVGSDTVIYYDADGAAGTSRTMKELMVLKGVQASSLKGSDFVGGYAPDGSSKGVTLIGTSGEDQLTGGALDDTISGGAGRDTIRGEAGNDTLNGGDELDSATGDWIDGGLGDDKINGGAGKDSLYGGGGADKLYGGTGADSLSGGDGNDLLDGGDDSDSLDGGYGSNTLLGGAGNDTLNSSTSDAGSDRLEGGAGNDTLTANGGTVVMYGDAGDDTFRLSLAYTQSTGSKFTVYGGDGNDTVSFGDSYYPVNATAQITGGAGRDTYVLAYAHKHAISITDFATGTGGDLVNVMGLIGATLKQNPFGTVGYLRLTQSGANTILQIDHDGAAGTAYGFIDFMVFSNTTASAFTRDNFVYGTSPDGSPIGLVQKGTEAADEMRGAFLDDQLEGMGGDDTLYGGEGNDTLDGGAGKDYLAGEVGDDVLGGGAGDDTLSDSQGSNTFNGGEGADTISSQTDGLSIVDGGAGNDIINIANGNHTVSGGAGDDLITVSYYQSWEPKKWTSTMNGGEGNDKFVLIAPNGASIRVAGGDGRDTYRLDQQSPNNTYVVTDFVAGTGGDLIDITSLLYSQPAMANPFAAGGIMRLVQEGAHTVLYWDSDGAGLKQFQAILTLENVAVTSLNSANFVGGYPPDGSNKAAPLSGTSGDDTLNGNGLDDTLLGGDGNDTLNGNAGSDVLEGGNGNDTLNGGAGNDMLEGGAGKDNLSDTIGNNTFHGGDGDDVIASSGDGTNFLSGGEGADRLSAGNGIDTLEGGGGADTLTLHNYNGAGGVARTLKVNGGDGNDQIIVQVFNELSRAEVTGGAGADLFNLYLSYSNSTVVTDFSLAEGDTLALSNWSGTSQNPFASGFARLAQSGTDTQLIVKSGGIEKVWATLKNVNASSLTYKAFAAGFDPRATVAVTIDGTEQVDRITGGEQGDTISGGAGNDYLRGLGGNDVLRGGAGNDSLNGGAGDDLLDGGAGLDWIYTDAWINSFKVSAENDGFLLQAIVGTHGNDTLKSVERLYFNDGAIALDVNTGAGQVYRLYQAAFDRKPDSGGLGFWIAQSDVGTSMGTIAESFMASNEFKAKYGATPTNAQLVAQFYQNVLHRAGEKSGVDFWVGVLDSKGASAAEVLAAFADSAENVEAVAKVIGNGFTYDLWSV